MDKKLGPILDKKEFAQKAFEDLGDDWPTMDPEDTMAHDDRFSDLHLNFPIKQNLTVDQKKAEHEKGNARNNRQ